AGRRRDRHLGAAARRDGVRGTGRTDLPAAPERLRAGPAERPLDGPARAGPGCGRRRADDADARHHARAAAPALGGRLPGDDRPYATSVAPYGWKPEKTKSFAFCCW